jgi:AcrR family transcriptional regulator
LALQNALHSLLAERGWDGINVQMLCDRADVSRSTFYLHFQNMEELLSDSLAGLSDTLRERAGTAALGTLPFVRPLIESVHEQRRLFRAVTGGRSGHIVRTRFRELVLQLVEEDISLVAAAGWRRDAGARFVTGALVELLAWWIEAGVRRSSIAAVAAHAGQKRGAPLT